MHMDNCHEKVHIAINNYQFPGNIYIRFSGSPEVNSSEFHGKKEEMFPQ